MSEVRESGTEMTETFAWTGLREKGNDAGLMEMTGKGLRQDPDRKGAELKGKEEEYD